MRKDVVAGLGLAGLVAVAAGASSYFDSRAIREVETVFAGLRSDGMIATHGAINVSLLNRRIDIADIVVKPAAGGGELAIAKLAINGITLTAADLGADRLEVTDLATGNLGGLTPGSHTSLKIPSLTATGVRSARALQAGGTSANQDPIERAMLLYSTLNAATIVAPTLAVSSTVAMPATRPGRGSQPTTVDVVSTDIVTTYTNVKLNGLRDGRVSHASFDRAAIAPDKGAAMFTGTIEGTTIAELDLMPIFGIGLANRTARDGYYAVQGKMTTGAYTFRMPDGAEFGIGGLSASGFDIDPTKLSYLQLRDMMATFTTVPAQPTPAQQQALLGAVTKMYEGMRFDAIDVRNISIAGPKNAPTAVNLTIGGMSMSRFSRGKFGEIRIDSISGGARALGGTAVPMKLGSFSLHGFDVVKIMKFATDAAAATPGKPPAPEQIVRLLSGLEGFEIIEVAVPHPQTGQIVQIDHLKANWGQYAGDLPSKIRLSFKGSVPLAAADPNTALLRQNGLQSISMNLEGDSSWDAGTRTLTEAASLDLARLGTLAVNATMGNVPRSAFSVRQGQFDAILPDIEIGAFQLQLQDKGFVKLVRAALGGDAQADPLAAFKQMLLDPGKPASNLAVILNGSSRFLAAHNQTLTLKFLPKGRVAIGQFLAPGALQGPEALVNALDSFALEAAVAP